MVLTGRKRGRKRSGVWVTRVWGKIDDGGIHGHERLIQWIRGGVCTRISAAGMQTEITNGQRLGGLHKCATNPAD